MEKVKKQAIGSLFCPYEISLELKELGFEEPCFGWYQNNRLKIEKHPTSSGDQTYMRKEDCFAPTQHQAFRWLYKNLGIKGSMPVDTESQVMFLKELIEKFKKK